MYKLILITLKACDLINMLYDKRQDMLFKRTFLLCLYADTNSLRLFKVAILGLQIIKYFSHKHKLHLFEAQL
jgi:hypothetical protein